MLMLVRSHPLMCRRSALVSRSGILLITVDRMKAKITNLLQVIELWQRKGTGAGADKFFVKALVNGEEVQLEGASPGKTGASASALPSASKCTQ